MKKPRNLRPQFLCLVALACAMSTPAQAGNPIDTDGPDFVESSEVVPKGRFQIEMDFVSERDQRNAVLRRTINTPTLMRYGIDENVELRLAGDTHVRETTSNSGTDTTVSGHGDLAIGLKWHTQDRDQAKNTPAVSWILHLVTPSGSEDFRGHGIRPSLRSVITWDLPHELSLGVMPGLARDSRADGHRFTSGILGISLAKRLTERFRIFVESSTSQVARAENGGVVSAWDIGTAYLLTDDWQLGGRFAVAANRNSPGSAFLVELAGRF
jgi:Putative MetA-pathway of phenol degradation